MRASKTKLYMIGFLAIISSLAFNSCNSYDNPVGSNHNNPKVQLESKWQVDPKSNTFELKIHEKEYDVEGYLLQLIEFAETGLKKSQSNYTYRNTQQSTEEKTFFTESGSEEKTEIIVKNYDNSGKIIQQETKDEKGNIICKKEYLYDNKGNVKSIIDFDPLSNQKDEKNFDYVYDKNGKIVERVTNLNPDGTYQSRDSIAYTSKTGFDLTRFDSQGKIENIKKYFYNNFGQIDTEIELNPKGEIITKFIFEYKYH